MENEILALRRSVRYTRIGTMFGFLAFGASAAYGLHRLGNKHHQVFDDIYQTHRSPSQLMKKPDELEHTVPIQQEKQT